MQRDPRKLDIRWTYFISILITCGSVIWLFYKDIANLWAIMGIVGGMITIFNIKRIEKSKECREEDKRDYE